MSFQFKSNIQHIQYVLLSGIILTLPSLEAPKNIFLIAFLFFAFTNEILKLKTFSWGKWDWVLLLLIGSAFLTTFFPGIHYVEWKGLRVFLSSTLTGWMILRSQFSSKQILSLLNFVVLGAIPPLIVGLMRYLYFHDKPDLQLHSVGHVNHSAIYLTIVLGVSIGLLNSLWNKSKSYQKILLVLLNTLFFISLIISQSRAAVGIGIFLSTLLFLIIFQNKRIKIGGILSVVVIIIFSILLNTGIIQKEIRNEQANDVLGARDKVWNISIEAARWAPVFGIGIDNWGKIKAADIKSSVEARGEVYNLNNYLFQGHSHSIYLTALVERGIVGFLVLLFFMVSWLYYLIRKFKEIVINNQDCYLWASSFSAWLVTFGIGFVNTTFHHEHGILACILFGLFISYMTYNKKTATYK